MLRYTLRRLLWMIPTLIGISIVTFLMIHLIPGDIVQVMLGTRTNVTPDQIASLRQMYGIDKPLWAQYLIWAGQLLRGNVGFSLRTGLSISQLIGQALPVTAWLTVLALMVSTLPAVAIGILAAIRRDSPADLAARLFAMAGLAIPGFWLGTILILLVSLYAPTLSSFTYVGFFQNPLGNLRVMMLPTFALAFALLGNTMRQTRGAMLEVLQQQYIQTARAKGLGERLVVLRHALRNALIPVVTIVGLDLGYLLGGAVVIENVFALPGMGRLIVSAINQRDYPLVQSGVLIMALLFVIVNLVVDMSYAFIDPRIRFDMDRGSGQ